MANAQYSQQISWTALREAVVQARSHKVSAGVDIAAFLVAAGDVYLMALGRWGPALSVVHAIVNWWFGSAAQPIVASKEVAVALLADIALLTAAIAGLGRSKWWLYCRNATHSIWSNRARELSIIDKAVLGLGALGAVQIVSWAIGGFALFQSLTWTFTVATAIAVVLTPAVAIFFVLITALLMLCLVRDTPTLHYSAASLAVAVAFYLVIAPPFLAHSYSAPEVRLTCEIICIVLAAGLPLGLYPAKVEHRDTEQATNLDVIITATDQDPPFYEYSATTLPVSIPTPINLSFQARDANYILLVRQLNEKQFRVTDSTEPVTALNTHICVWNVSVLQRTFSGKLDLVDRRGYFRIDAKIYAAPQSVTTDRLVARNVVDAANRLIFGNKGLSNLFETCILNSVDEGSSSPFATTSTDNRKSKSAVGILEEIHSFVMSAKLDVILTDPATPPGPAIEYQLRSALEERKAQRNLIVTTKRSAEAHANELHNLTTRCAEISRNLGEVWRAKLATELTQLPAADEPSKEIAGILGFLGLRLEADVKPTADALEWCKQLTQFQQELVSRYDAAVAKYDHAIESLDAMLKQIVVATISNPAATPAQGMLVHNLIRGESEGNEASNSDLLPLSRKDLDHPT